MNKGFFDHVRATLFGGRLRQAQVDGLSAIVGYGLEHGYTRFQIAYALATTHHETGRRMVPLREGFCKTDAGSRRAVANLYAKGIIRRNYALPDANGNSFYGRGLIQITHKYNYAKFEKITGLPLSKKPDLALTWEASLPILYVGLAKGLFTGKKVPKAKPDLSEIIALRAAVNGDVRKHGRRIAYHTVKYYQALEHCYGRKKRKA